MKSQKYKKETFSATKKRILLMSVAMLLFASYLILNLIKLQIFGYNYYKEKVYDQVTTTSALKAERGNIYDSSLGILASTSTDWRIFISTKEIKTAEIERGIEYSKIISKGLSEILNIDEETLLNKIKSTNVLDVTIKKSASKEEYEKIIEFTSKNNLEKLIFTEAQSSRYYPEGTLAAHVLGFCGSDNQGLYGLEYYYDDILSGKNGYYLYAKDASGNELNTEYSTYVPAENGYSLVTTIDTYIQQSLESELEIILKNHAVQNRVAGIVMNVETGAILAMATSSPFNPNSPYQLDEISQFKLDNCNYDKNSEEYKKLKRELLEIMWSNKAISETYEPGSTFKIITVSAALDLRVASMKDRFSCHGYHTVGGWRIKCHKVTGHGSGFDLAYGLQMSCNPTMMQVAERIGPENFYKYVAKFGYFEKTGIDLPSEASTIFHKLENIGATELATASFGQRFKVSIINQLTAVAAVANGGVRVTPHIVDRIIDENGNIISIHNSKESRVISSEVAKEIADVLEAGVSGDGGAKNARVDGYKVAAKTGTSQKFDILDENGNSYLRIGSTVAFAPSDEHGIAVIIVVDEPTTAVKYGSVVAAPYVGDLLQKILPYLNYNSTIESINKPVPNLIGLDIASAKKILNDSSLQFEIVGTGDTVLAQTPSWFESITFEHSKIILYTVKKNEYVIVPALTGLKFEDAVKIAINSGLNISINGSGAGTVTAQSIPMLANVKRGTVIILTTMIVDYED